MQTGAVNLFVQMKIYEPTEFLLRKFSLTLRNLKAEAYRIIGVFNLLA